MTGNGVLQQEALGRVHFIGIGGVGMSAVARIMVARGVPVSGSDAKDLPVMADLAAAGATFSDVVRLTFYVVDWKREMISDFLAGIEQVAKELNIAPAPASLIGVSVLFEPGVLVEIEATAVVA